MAKLQTPFCKSSLTFVDSMIVILNSELQHKVILHKRCVDDGNLVYVKTRACAAI